MNLQIRSKIIQSRSLVTIVILTIISFFLTGCAGLETRSDSDKPLIAVTFYPYYDLTKNIAGEFAEVYSVVPRSIDPHSFEPTPRDIARLQNIIAYVKTGVEFEAFEDRLINAVPSGVHIIDGSEGIRFLASDHHHEHDEHEHGSHEHHEEHHNEHDEHEHGSHEHHEDHHHEHDEHEQESHEHHEGHHHHHGENDPHVWLTPTNAIRISENILRGLQQADPANAEGYALNAANLIASLQELSEEYAQGLAVCEKDTILVTHNAFQYLAHEYGFNVLSISGLSHESEPTPRQLAALIDAAREHDIGVVFFEELVSPRVAETIAREVGAEVLPLSPIEGSLEGKGYIELMRENLNNLRISLVCQ
ncbi:MAG: metal ABC transporter substrate-binding protein [Candidatus Woesearchaeota archaeon]